MQERPLKREKVADKTKRVDQARFEDEHREEQFREDQQNIIEDDLILKSVLMGGEKSKIDSLYNAYWTLLGEIQSSLRDEKTAATLAKGPLIQKFLKVVSSPSPDVSHDVPNTSKPFQNLSHEVQNLLLAATELNIKLSQYEQDLTENLSKAYAFASKSAADCVLIQIGQLKKYESDVLARTKQLHLQSVQNMMGARYGIFMNKAIQGLQAWSVLSSRLGVVGLRKSDWSTIESIFDALKEAKRNVLSAKIKFASKKDFELAKPEEDDKRFLIRMQKHQLSLERAEKTNLLRNQPEELAKALRILRVADDELGEALSKSPPTPLSKQEIISSGDKIENSEDEKLSELYGILANLVDHGHVLAVESESIRKSMENQVRKELIDEIESVSQQSLKCVQDTKSRLKAMRTSAVQKYQDEVKQTRDAERTIATELQFYGRSTKIAALSIEVCAKAISDASKSRKIARDTKTLNYHKIVMRETLETLLNALRSLSS